jgi:hypothetical protein
MDNQLKRLYQVTLENLDKALKDEYPADFAFGVMLFFLEKLAEMRLEPEEQQQVKAILKKWINCVHDDKNFA